MMLPNELIWVMEKLGFEWPDIDEDELRRGGRNGDTADRATVGSSWIPCGRHDQPRHAGGTVVDEELSEAVVAYLGKGRSSFPRTDEDAVAPLAESAGRPELLATVKALVGECLAVQVDWSTRSLSEGGREAQAVMAERHPELSAAALEALYSMFTYNWR